MAPRSVTWALRAVLAIEFAAALATWAAGVCPWMVSGAVATGALTVLMLTWGEAGGEPAPASRPHCRAARAPSRYW